MKEVPVSTKTSEEVRFFQATHTFFFSWFNTFLEEEGLAQLVSARTFVREVPQSSIPECDLKSFFRLLSFPCTFK